MRLSAAMTGEAESRFVAHLLRPDGQEDLCFAIWMPSTGRDRLTAILKRPVLPGPCDRQVHGNASFEATYALRAVREAAAAGGGLAFIHSHPDGGGWQSLNDTDRVAEARIANLAREVTELPLVGLTLAGDRSWSGRFWSGAGRLASPAPVESVRVIGDVLSVTFNERLIPSPEVQLKQDRTVHTWGVKTQASMARLRVAVAGTGSVGMVVADVLARTGVERVGIFDFDTVEVVNLDRLRGASPLDAALKRPKVHVARRLLAEGSTAGFHDHEIRELSICEPEGVSRLLDYDMIFSCVDRPWPRHVLNTVAYADLIPVIDGGLSAFRNADDTLRNAYWRSSIARPGRPCLACLRQYDPAMVQIERDGSLDDPSYIANLPPGSPLRRRENVAALSASVSAAMLEQFVSYVARPSGFGDPGPLRFSLRDHTVEREPTVCDSGCLHQASVGSGDARLDPSSRHLAAERARHDRATVPIDIRARRWLDDRLWSIRHQLAIGRRSD